MDMNYVFKNKSKSKQNKQIIELVKFGCDLICKKNSVMSSVHSPSSTGHNQEISRLAHTHIAYTKIRKTKSNIKVQKQFMRDN